RSIQQHCALVSLQHKPIYTPTSALSLSRGAFREKVTVAASRGSKHKLLSNPTHPKLDDGHLEKQGHNHSNPKGNYAE
ncbi:MAG: hypothetical protein ACR2PW_06340, partial [Gammaproteobacteria bacterium]